MFKLIEPNPIMEGQMKRFDENFDAVQEYREANLPIITEEAEKRRIIREGK